MVEVELVLAERGAQAKFTKGLENSRQHRGHELELLGVILSRDFERDTLIRVSEPNRLS